MMTGRELNETETQRWAYGLVLVLSGIALGVSGMPAPLYGMYESLWHISPFTTTVVFGVYAATALVAVLVSGRISDVIGRKPVLLFALGTMLVGLAVFLTADNVAMLMLARAFHGAAVGSIVVSGAAALLDLRPHRSVRSGQLSGVAFNVGISAAILGSALLAEYVPHPLRTPYAVVAVLCLTISVGVVALDEPHRNPTRGRITLSRPNVPRDIRGDFWFAALSVMASWSVLGVLLSLFPSLAEQHTEVRGVVFGGSVVATYAFSAAVAQLAATRVPAITAAIVGNIGMAGSLILTVPALLTHRVLLVFATLVALGVTFGLGFGGSIRHLSSIVPPNRRGETMSAYYVLAYSALAVPTITAGWAATRWSLVAVYPWFVATVAVACLVAAGLGARQTLLRRRRAPAGIR